MLNQMLSDSADAESAVSLTVLKLMLNQRFVDCADCDLVIFPTALIRIQTMNLELSVVPK